MLGLFVVVFRLFWVLLGFDVLGYDGCYCCLRFGFWVVACLYFRVLLFCCCRLVLLISGSVCLLLDFVIRLLTLGWCGYGACFGFVACGVCFFGLDVISIGLPLRL